MRVVVLSLPLLFSFAFACSDTAGKSDAGATADAGDDGASVFNTGAELRVTVPQTGRVYVRLNAPAAVVTPADPKNDPRGWDIAFEGLEVYTNSGPSGAGGVQGFGPLDAVAFIDDNAPQVPFLSGDKTGGAFLRWYFYDGSNHVLDSRFHTYGVKDGDKQYKVQVLGYYGDRNGAPVSALYRVRWSEITAAGPGTTQDIATIDGTAGGPTAPTTSPSDCLDLGTGVHTPLTEAQALQSTAWHLCFRRESISVNGELGGPRNVGAVDLDADKTASETLSDVNGRTPESELGKFDAVNAPSLAGQTFRGDRVVSPFSNLWIEKGSNPPAPRQAAWFLVGSDLTSKFLIGFARFEGATATNPGTIVMKVKPVK
jgi:hypothetical protein